MKELKTTFSENKPEELFYRDYEKLNFLALMMT